MVYPHNRKLFTNKKEQTLDFPGGSVVKNPPAMQETGPQSVIQEDATCCRVTKLVHLSYYACALEPRTCNYWAHTQRLLNPTHLEPGLLELGAKKSTARRRPLSASREKGPSSSEDPAQTKINIYLIFKKFLKEQSLIHARRKLKNTMLSKRNQTLQRSTIMCCTLKVALGG